MDTWSQEELDKIGGAEELELATLAAGLHRAVLIHRLCQAKCEKAGKGQCLAGARFMRADQLPRVGHTSGRCIPG